MRLVKFAAPALVLALGITVYPTTSFGKAAYATKEKKACTYCHTKAGSKDLNDAGKYYQEHNHSLEGYKG
jgi:hypothetical protein